MVAEIVVLSILGVAVYFTQKDLINVKKSLGEMETVLIKENEKIDENFKKVQDSLSLAEREIKHVFTVAENAQKKQYPSVRAVPVKVVGNKAMKFLTPKGKIKKHYRDNPTAQKFYAKFHNLQTSI